MNTTSAEGQVMMMKKMLLLLLHVKLDRIIFIVALLESVALENTVTVQKSFFLLPESYSVELVSYCGVVHTISVV